MRSVVSGVTIRITDKSSEISTNIGESGQDFATNLESCSSLLNQVLRKCGPEDSHQSIGADIAVHIEAELFENDAAVATNVVLQLLDIPAVKVLKILDLPVEMSDDRDIHARMWLRDTFGNGSESVTVIGMNPSTAEHLQYGSGSRGDQTAGKLRATFSPFVHDLALVNLVPVFMTDSKKTGSVWQRVTREFQEILISLGEDIFTNLLQRSTVVVPMWGTQEGPLDRWKKSFSESYLEQIFEEQHRRMNTPKELQVKALPIDGGSSAAHSLGWPSDAYGKGLLTDARVIAKTVHNIEV